APRPRRRRLLPQAARLGIRPRRSAQMEQTLFHFEVCMKSKSPPARCAAVLVAGIALLPLSAADWPQWQGPDRSNVSPETGLLKEWPSQGPKLLWTFTGAGAGYSGPSIVGDRLYTMGADDSTEYLFAIDLTTQKKLWSAEIGSRFD